MCRLVLNAGEEDCRLRSSSGYKINTTTDFKMPLLVIKKRCNKLLVALIKLNTVRSYYYLKLQNKRFLFLFCFTLL